MSSFRDFGRAVRAQAYRSLTSVGRAVAKATTFDAETMRAFLQGDTIGENVGKSYRSLVTHGYEKNVNIARAINEIAVGVASVPIEVHVNGKKVDNHPLGELLARPSPMMSRTRFFIELTSYFLLDGNGFVQEISFPGESDAQPLALQVLRPDLVDVARERAGLIGSTIYTYDPLDGPKRVWRVRDTDENAPILHIRGFSPEGALRGQAPLLSARSAIDRHNLSEEWNANTIKNGAKIPGVLLVEKDKGDGALTDSERESLKTMIEEMVSGAKNAGKIPVLEGGVKWQPTGWSPTDVDWSGGKASAARDCANALGYPPMLLAIPGDNTFTNQREARLALWENTIIPLLGLILEDLSNWLGPRYGSDVVLRPKLDAVSALALRRERTWDRVKDSEFLDINEQRAEVGFDKRPEAEAAKLYVTYSKVPLDAIGDSVVLQENSTGPAEDTGDSGEEPREPSAP